MTLRRRDLLRLGAAAPLAGLLPHAASGQMPPMAHSATGLAAAQPPTGPADYSIRIANGLLELGEEAIVSTKLYNGQFPGPLIRLTEGKEVTVDVQNDTDTPELLHWHGQFLPGDQDGAYEEGSPFIPAHGMRRLQFVPAPRGFRYYHTHVPAYGDLTMGTYTGQAGPVYVEPRDEPGRYDREVFLTLKEFDATFNRTEMAEDFLAPTTEVKALRDASVAATEDAAKKGVPNGFELTYSLFSINGRMLGHGDPIKVKQGERVLFHVLNASATEIRSLALPGHTFRVVALDGNPVPTPTEVPVLWIGTAERVSAIVEMKSPGIWVMGDLMDEDRERGMGIIVEYAGATGKPIWTKPAPFRWNYASFGKSGTTVRKPDQILEMTISSNPGAVAGFDQFMLNDVAFSMQKMDPLFKLKLGGRYRLRLRNATDDIHPMHLHRHSFELTRIAGQPTAGVVKDVVMVGRYQEVEVDFTADQPGLSLFHCHMQPHMDFGLMCLFECG